MAVKKLTRLEQVLLVVAVGVIGMFFFVGKVWDPMNEEMEATVTEYNKLVKDLNELGNRPRGSAMVEKKIDELRPEAAKLESRVAELRERAFVGGDEEEREFELLVNTVAKNNGVNVREFVRLDKVCSEYKTFSDLQLDCGELKRRAYALKATGGFLDFIGFVNELGTLRKTVNITGVDLSDSGYGRGVVEISAVVVL
jgi:Tfp pilus assembly protein PilO